MTIGVIDHATPVAATPRERTTATATPAGGDFDAILSATRAGQPETPAMHEVRAGETLSEIVLTHLRSKGQHPSSAELYDKVAEVAAANGIRDPDRIYPGQALRLETPVAAASMPSPDPAREQLVRALVPPADAGSRRKPDVGGPRRPVEDFGNVRFETLRQVATELSGIISYPIRYAKGAESLLRQLPSVSVRAERPAVAALSPTDRPSLQEAETTTPESPWSKILAEPARLTSGFGPRRDPFDGSKGHHDGIDLATERGAKIFPMSDGVVKFAGWMPGYGNVVVVKHEEGMESIYGHNAKNLVRAGQRVAATDAVATVGSSGRSTGPHVHFEVRKNGRAVDPVPHLCSDQG